MPLIQSPDKGLNSTKPDNQLEPTEAGSLTQNIVYRNGEARSAFGYERFGASGLPLNAAVLDTTQYPEIRTDTVHIVVATSGELYKYDSINDDWDDITNIAGDTLSDINSPTSWAVIGHTDSVDSSFQHLLYCDGGKTAIQRWAGETETNFKDLLGASGYNDPSSTIDTHFAQQIDIFNSHVILLNAKEANASDALIDNKQRVRWGVTGKLEVYSGTTSGFVDLIDTGGTNIRGRILGNRYIIYQNNSVWGLNPVGGSTVFTPEVLLPDLGLLAPHLLTGSNNVHYFVGDDFNVYQYYGGSVRQRISDNILKLFRADIDDSFVGRCWLTIGPENKRLWLFYVPDGKEFMTQAFVLDIQQGKWMPRSFSHVPEYSGNKGTATGGGITTANLIGSQTLTTGESYRDVDPVAGDTYNDILIGDNDTYREVLNEIVTSDKLTIGDSNGNIYQFSETLKTDDGNNIPCTHYTPVFDGGLVDKNKRWPQFHVVSRGDSTIVEYSIDDGPWVEITASPQALVDDYKEYEFYINETSKRIQFRQSNFEDGEFRTREFDIADPLIEENR